MVAVVADAGPPQAQVGPSRQIHSLWQNSVRSNYVSNCKPQRNTVHLRPSLTLLTDFLLDAHNTRLQCE